MIRALLPFYVALLVTACPARAERLWLVVGASDVSAADIAAKSKPLFQRYPSGLIVQTQDCGDKKNVFAWVAGVATSAADAKDTLTRVHPSLSDAYIKRCDAKSNSLIAMRLSAIDPSIADVPSDAVNWDDTDRVSGVRPLADGRALAIVRYYASAPDDPLEGRRERVLLLDSPTKRTTLENNCPNPGPPATMNGRIAFACAREQAGEHLLHSVVVFSAKGDKLTEIQRCRNPKWTSQSVIACDAETVGADGKLKLKNARIELTKSEVPAQ